MEMKEYLSRIRQRILKDGAENTLKMIREQKIRGPSASEIFGKAVGDQLAKAVDLARASAACETETGIDGSYGRTGTLSASDGLPCTLPVYSITESGPKSAEDFRPANDDYFSLAVAA